MNGVGRRPLTLIAAVAIASLCASCFLFPSALPVASETGFLAPQFDFGEDFAVLEDVTLQPYRSSNTLRRIADASRLNLIDRAAISIFSFGKTDPVSVILPRIELQNGSGKIIEGIPPGEARVLVKLLDVSGNSLGQGEQLANVIAGRVTNVEMTLFVSDLVQVDDSGALVEGAGSIAINIKVEQAASPFWGKLKVVPTRNTVTASIGEIKGEPKQYYFDFGDGQSTKGTSPTATHEYLNSGTYRIEAWMLGGGDQEFVSGTKLVGPSFTVTTLPPKPTPPPVSGVGVSYDEGIPWNLVNWNSASAADRYKIYWGTSSGVTSTSEYYGATTDTKAGHTGVVPGSKYCYRVLAENEMGVGPLSSEVCVTLPTPKPPSPTPPPVTPPGEIRGLKVQFVDRGGPDNHNLVTWTRDANSVSYRMYWGTSRGVSTGSNKYPDGTTLSAGHGFNSSIVPGMTYCYRVQGIGATGNLGPLSTEEACVTAPPLANFDEPVLGKCSNPSDRLSCSAVYKVTSGKKRRYGHVYEALCKDGGYNLSQFSTSALPEANGDGMNKISVRLGRDKTSGKIFLLCDGPSGRKMRRYFGDLDVYHSYSKSLKAFGIGTDQFKAGEIERVFTVEGNRMKN